MFRCLPNPRRTCSSIREFGRGLSRCQLSCGKSDDVESSLVDIHLVSMSDVNAARSLGLEHCFGKSSELQDVLEEGKMDPAGWRSVLSLGLGLLASWPWLFPAPAF